MAVGTVVIASLWSELTDPDQANESYSILAKGMHNIIMAVILRKCRNLGKKSVKHPLLGTMSVLSLLVIIFCLAFAVFWEMGIEGGEES
ncbi:unnamed protein product [Microthlaspi erraticum]|uniref:Uncharacterized protein n=1 Tax=Microthlaspi erraticum TaxID=1685480 RepID=A0A6D2J7N0_9BRAS|nr:unnamed protein product [Microthlaspi erraticum]CAA7043699.1 unnamed protein product [Microthlaspi erraticum]